MSLQFNCGECGAFNKYDVNTNNDPYGKIVYLENKIRDLESSIEDYKNKLNKFNALEQLADPKSRQPVTDLDSIKIFRDEFLEPYPNYELKSTGVFEIYREWCDKTYSSDVGPKNAKSWGIILAKGRLFDKKVKPGGVRLIGYRFKSI